MNITKTNNDRKTRTVLFAVWKGFYQLEYKHESVFVVFCSRTLAVNSCFRFVFWGFFLGGWVVINLLVLIFCLVAGLLDCLSAWSGLCLLHGFHVLTFTACREQTAQKIQTTTRSPDQNKRGASVLDVWSLLGVLAQSLLLINAQMFFSLFRLFFFCNETKRWIFLFT